MEEITGEDIPEDPWVCLFHGTAKTLKSYQSSIVPILLDAAKKQIAIKWLDPASPNIRDWLLCINEVYNVESVDSRGMAPEEGVVREGKWEGWQMYKKTWSYAEEFINTT